MQGGNQVRTCDQIITPAKNASVCSISFSALRPAKTTKSPDFCIVKAKEQMNIKQLIV